MPAEIKITVLLEHHKGDNNWTSRVPLIEGCLAEGSTPEEATQAIIPEIEYFTQRHPGLVSSLADQPEFRLSTVSLPIGDNKADPISNG